MKNETARSLCLRLWYGGAGGLMGVFLAVRLRAFLVQAWTMTLPLGLVLLLAPALALLGVLLAPVVERHLKAMAFGGRRWSWWIYILCLAVCVAGRKLVLDEAIQGGGLWLPSWLELLTLVGGGVLLGVFTLHLLFAVWEGLPALGRWFAGLQRRDWLTLLVLWLLVNVAVFAYATGSQTICSWDSAIYWRSTYTPVSYTHLTLPTT